MSENIFIDKTKSDAEIYESLVPQIESLIEPGIPLVSNLSNVVSALYNAFDKMSWTGFYLLKDSALYLGPFNGNPACTYIAIGKGVCGVAAEKRETIIVEDVEKFPGHIACDAGSRSEIVLPVIYGDSLFGVLDIDSYEYSAFNETDKKYLERIVDILTTKLNLSEKLL